MRGQSWSVSLVASPVGVVRVSAALRCEADGGAQINGGVAMTSGSDETRLAGRQHACEAAGKGRLDYQALKERSPMTWAGMCLERGVESPGCCCYSKVGIAAQWSFPPIGLERKVRGTAFVCLPLINRLPTAPAETGVYTITAKYLVMTLSQSSSMPPACSRLPKSKSYIARLFKPSFRPVLVGYTARWG